MNAIITIISKMTKCHKDAIIMERTLHKTGLLDNRALLEYMLLRTARYTHLACHWQPNTRDPQHPAAHWDITN